MLHQNQIILIVKSDFDRNIFSVYWLMSSGFCRTECMLRSTVHRVLRRSMWWLREKAQGREPAIFLQQKYKIAHLFWRVHSKPCVKLITTHPPETEKKNHKETRKKGLELKQNRDRKQMQPDL